MIALDRGGRRVADRKWRPEPAVAGSLLVLLDRDGTVLEHRPGHVLAVDEAVFLPGALRALRELASLGVATALVSNQSGVARKLIDEASAIAVHQYVLAEAARAGADIFASFICPHGPEDGCACRKPATAMIEAACEAAAVPPARTILVGDAYSDVAAAVAAGVTPVLVSTGLGRASLARLRAEGRDDVVVRPSLLGAVSEIRRLLAGPRREPELGPAGVAQR